MTTYTLTVSTNTLGLGVLNGARVVVDRKRTQVTDVFNGQSLSKNSVATNSLGIATILLEPDDGSVYHELKIFDLAGILVYSKIFIMPPQDVAVTALPVQDIISSSAAQAVAAAVIATDKAVLTAEDRAQTGVDAAAAAAAADAAASDAASIIVATKKFNTYDEQMAYVGAYVDGQKADVLGYYAIGDGGLIPMVWSASSTATHNKGTVRQPTAVIGAGRWLATNPETTTLKQWGCVGDGTITDDSTKINDYLTYMAAAGYKATGVGTYRIDSKITIKGNADFSEVNINVYGSPAIAVEVSTGNAANPTTTISNMIIVLPKTVINVDKVGVGWGSTVGVRAVNPYSSIITTGRIEGFGTGLLVTSYGSNGNVYNTYNIGWLENNKVNLSLTPAEAESWVNENLFIGGRFSHESAEGTNVAGVRHIYLAKSTNVVNNNVFIKPSIEGDAPEYHIECGGSYNQFNQARWEAATPKILYTGDNINQGTRNIIDGGYNSQNIVYAYTGTTGTNNRSSGAGFAYETMNQPYGISNKASSSNDVFRFYEAGTLPETAGASEWSLGIGSSNLQGKRKADAYKRMKLDFQNGRIYFDNGTTAAPTKYIGAFGSDDFAFTNHVSASVDNTYTCGRASQRWTVVYATTGTINTSDERSKQQITSDLSSELRAWSKVEFCKYKLNDAVEIKKDGARWHFGVIAQQVKAAFEDEGLDPFAYGILCYDEWDAEEEVLDEVLHDVLDDDGKVVDVVKTVVIVNNKRDAGNRYGIRYEEALILECAYLRSRIDK